MSPRAPSPDEALTIALPVSGEVSIRAFPHDGRFLRDIRRAALAVRPTASSEHELRELLERALRAWYPRVQVHAQDAFGRLSNAEHLWYVMRDGKVTAARDMSDRLYQAMSDARATAEESDIAVQRAHATYRLASQPRSSQRNRARDVAEAADRHADPT